ncbi:MAG: hypothetical protein ACT4PG_09930 [Panacagrimonas sp.]
MKHDCPIPGCEARVPNTLLMCNAHWLAVPKSQRRDVNRTWRRFSRANDAPRGEYADVVEALNTYRDACDAAVKTVAESELPLCQ